MSLTVLLRCSHCQSINRVLKNKLGDAPKCGQCKEALNFPKQPVDVTSHNFHQEVTQAPGLVLVDFWAPYCGHCMRLLPILDELAREYAGILKIVKVNTGLEQSLPGQFGVRGIPHLVLFEKGGKIAESSGFMPKPQLLAWIREKTPSL